MTTLVLYVVLGLLALAALVLSLAFTRACMYASLLDELDGSARIRPTRAPRARAGVASAAHGRNLPQRHALARGCVARLGHEAC